MQNDNTNTPRKKTAAPKARSLTQSEVMDVVESTLRDSANAVNNIGTIIRLTAGAIFAFIDSMKEAKAIKIIDDPEGARGLMAKKLAAEIAANLEKKLDEKK